MLPPDLTRWIINEETRNILFFAQLIEELLFNYSLDIYKVPAFNTKILCKELLQITDETDNPGFDAEDIRPVIEELIQEIQEDPVVDEVSPKIKKQLVEMLADFSEGDRLRSLVYQLYGFFETNYIERIGDLLKEKIVNGEREAVVKMTKVFLTELIDVGYSPEYIFFENKSFFFDDAATRKIEDYSVLDDFLRNFSSIPKFWNVVFRTGKDFKLLRNFPEHMNVTMASEKPDISFPAEDKNISIFLDRNFKLSHYLTFVDIEAFDGFSARQIAEQKLLMVEKFSRFHVHRTDLEWSRAALVYDLEKSTSGIYGKPVSAILKRPDHNTAQLSRLLHNTIVTVFSDKLDDDSIQRLLRAFQRHDLAINSPSPESQLLELWSAVEILFPAPRKKEDNSVQIIANLVHYASKGYAAKVAADLIKSIRNAESRKAMEVLDSVPQGHNIIEKCLLLVAADAFRPQREQLCDCLGDHILLVERIRALNRGFASASSFQEVIGAYSVGTSWQIRRILRALATMRDSGKGVISINKLVENLHSYLDRVIDVLLGEIARKREATSILAIHREIAEKSVTHLDMLRQRKDERSTPENFRFIFFGNND
ncbi:MAG: hypothetical protein GXY54_11220 [Deltaproteobacteria bacterium]|nr:hypothetical protein [Deltaproteobacteria bacterium]